MTQDTLEVVAGKINALQDKIGKADADRRKYLDSRNALILEAHERVSADPALTWDAWRVENIPDIGRAQVFRVIAASNPQPIIGRTCDQSSVVDPDKLYPRVAPIVEEDPFVGTISIDVLPKLADPLAEFRRLVQSFPSMTFDRAFLEMIAEAIKLARVETIEEALGMFAAAGYRQGE